MNLGRTVRVELVAACIAILLSSPIGAQAPNELPWKPPLATGGAPLCPERAGVRTLRSGTVEDGNVTAVLLGTAEKQSDRSCAFDAEVSVAGDKRMSLKLPDPGKQDFSIVDFSKNGDRLLISADHHLEYPNEQHRNISVAVLTLSNGSLSWVNAWDAFGWGDCDAMVEPQGFTPDGGVLVRVRPSVMGKKRRPDCVSEQRFYETDLASPPKQLHDSTRVERYGKAVRDAEAPCKTDPDIISACFFVRGRLSLYEGTPTVRIWLVGTKRILGVSDEFTLPVRLDGMDWDREAWGTFEVCPFTKNRPGVMRSVCVESAKGLSFKETQ